MERALGGHGVGAHVRAGRELQHAEIEGRALLVDRRAEGGCGVRDLVELGSAATRGARLTRGIRRLRLDAGEEPAHAALEAPELTRHEARPGRVDGTGAARERLARDSGVIDVGAVAAEVLEAAAGSEVDPREREQFANARLFEREEGFGAALVLVRQALRQRCGIADRAAEIGRTRGIHAVVAETLRGRQIRGLNAVAALRDRRRERVFVGADRGERGATFLPGGVEARLIAGFQLDAPEDARSALVESPELLRDEATAGPRRPALADVRGLRSRRIVEMAQHRRRVR